MAVGVVEALREVLIEMGVPPHVVARLLGGQGTPSVNLCKAIVVYTKYFFRYVGESFALCTEYSAEDLLAIFDVLVGDYPDLPAAEVDDSAQSSATEGSSDRIVEASGAGWTAQADHSPRDDAIKARVPKRKRPKQPKTPQASKRKQLRPHRVPRSRSRTPIPAEVEPVRAPSPVKASKKFATIGPRPRSDFPGPYRPTALEAVIAKLEKEALARLSSRKRKVTPKKPVKPAKKSTKKSTRKFKRLDPTSSEDDSVSIARSKPKRQVNPPSRLSDELGLAFDIALEKEGRPPLSKHITMDIFSSKMSKAGIAARAARLAEKAPTSKRGTAPTKSVKALSPGVPSSSRLRRDELPSWSGFAIAGLDEEDEDSPPSSPEKRPRRGKELDEAYEPSPFTASASSDEDYIPKKSKGKGKGKGKGKKK